MEGSLQESRWIENERELQFKMKKHCFSIAT
jgi:hypothetical protein